MKISEILREVARRVEKNPNLAWNGLCEVIDNVGTNQRDRNRAIRYLKFFRDDTDSAWWFGYPTGKHYYVAVKYNIRIVAACFAACLAEDNGD